MAVTSDRWTSKATEAYATTSHHIDEWNLMSCVLETRHFPESHTGINVSEQIRKAVDLYDVNPQTVAAIVHNEAANEELAGEFCFIATGPDISSFDSVTQ